MPKYQIHKKLRALEKEMWKYYKRYLEEKKERKGRFLNGHTYSEMPKLKFTKKQSV